MHDTTPLPSLIKKLRIIILLLLLFFLFLFNTPFTACLGWWCPWKSLAKNWGVVVAINFQAVPPPPLLRSKIYIYVFTTRFNTWFFIFFWRNEEGIYNVERQILIRFIWHEFVVSKSLPSLHTQCRDNHDH